MFIGRPNLRENPDQERRAVDEQRPNEPKLVAPRPMRAEHGRVADRRGAFLATTDPGRTPSTYGWRHASRDRTHRSARDWQRYVVGKVLLSPRTAWDPDAGAGSITASAAGTRAGELATRSAIERGGWLKSSRYATIASSHPQRRCARGEAWSIPSVYEIVYEGLSEWLGFSLRPPARRSRRTNAP